MSNKTLNNKLNAYETKLHMAEYKVTEGQFECDGKRYLSYGIDAYVYSLDLDNKRLVMSIPDITSDKDGITALVDCCNSSELSLEHLYEVVEDFLQ